MKRGRLVAGAVGMLLLLMPAHVHSLAAGGDILISEVQTGTTHSASDEFVELYNTSGRDIDVSSYKVEYYSASSDLTTPSRTMPLHGTLGAGRYYLLASSGYLADTATDSFSAGLSKTGGHLLLVSPDPADITKDVIHDLIGWGTALHPETKAAPSPPDSSSLERWKDVEGNYVDTDNNGLDFGLNNTPTPTADPLLPPVTTTTTDTTATDQNQTPATDPASNATDASLPTTPATDPVPQLLPLQITELLPNPAPPASDSTDEYIELYNPNNEAVDLSGYKLQSGSSYSYSHTFTSGTLGANSYQAFMVTETADLLANSGGKARLIDPTGNVISETPAYGDATDGQAWALVNGGWTWTTTPTPNEANILTAPLAKDVQTMSKPKTPPAKKTTSTPKVKAASTKKPSTTTKKKAASAGASNDQSTTIETQPAALHPGVLAGVSVLAVGYAAYEYRHDFFNRLYQFRRYRESRRANRQATSGS